MAAPCPERRPFRSFGSHRMIEMTTARPISEKANSGPARPTSGSTNKGATAGPMIVPRPNEEDKAESAATRPPRRVRDARKACAAAARPGREISLRRGRGCAAETAVDRAENRKQAEGERAADPAMEAGV